MQKIQLFKKRSFSETVGASFELLRDNFRLIWSCFLFLIMPFLILSLVTLAFGAVALSRSRATMIGAGSGVPVSFYIGYIGFFLTFYIQVVVIHEIVIAYEHSEDPRLLRVSDIVAMVREDMSRIIISFFAQIPLYILFGLVAYGVIAFTRSISDSAGGLGILIVYVGYMYISVCLSSYLMLRLRSEYDVLTAFTRSVAITYGRWWRTFSMHMILFFVAMSFYSVAMLPFIAVVAIIKYHSTSYGSDISESMVIGAVALVYLCVIFCFLCNLIFLGVTVNYYSLIEEKEHVGLQVSISEIGIEDSAIKMQEGDY